MISVELQTQNPDRLTQSQYPSSDIVKCIIVFAIFNSPLITDFGQII